MNHSFLNNQLLIAMPGLKDSYFEGSVIYLCSHTDDGALGLVINKPAELSLEEVFEQLDMTDKRPYPTKQTVLRGGPVEGDKGFVLHESDKRWNSTVTLDQQLKLTTSKDILADIALDNGPDEYLVSLGCCGWSAGQLEEEISDNSWLVCPSSRDILFSDDFSNMANLATSVMGFNMVQLTPDVGYC